MWTKVAAVALVAVAGPVRAQEAAGRSLDAVCSDLLRGTIERTDDLVSRCEGLLRRGAAPTAATAAPQQAPPPAAAPQQAPPPAAAPQQAPPPAAVAQQVPPPAAVAQQAPPPGTPVRTASLPAAPEPTPARTTGLGATSRGVVRNTLVTYPIGWFTGLGVNAEYVRPLEGFEKLSWIVGGRFARANASNGNVTTFGTEAGVDLFLFGRNNEGLRIGPRVELSMGSESVQGSSTFARLGASGELGYNIVVSSGLSGAVAGGFGFRVAGDSRNRYFESFTGGEPGPYAKLGIGYSW